MSSTSLSGIFPAGASPVAFDTLRYSKRLQELGFTQAQAEGFAEIQRELIEEQLATKADLYAVKADPGLKLEAMRKDLTVELERLGDRLSIRFGVMLIAWLVADILLMMLP